MVDHQLIMYLFSNKGYDPQTGYAVAYFRHSVDEARNDGIPSVQEVCLICRIV